MNRVIWILIWTLCISTCGAAEGEKAVDPEKRGGLKGDVEPLRIVAQAHQANRDSIKTWRGRATIEVQSYEEGKSSIERWIKSSVTFAYDRDRAATRWNYTREEDRSITDSKEIKTNKKPYINNGMKKDGVFYELYYENQGQRRTMMIRPAHYAQRGMHAENFDPMWYLTNSGKDLKERLLFYYREANNPRLSLGRVEQDGDKVILETRSGNVINRYKFDLSLGGNLITYYGADSMVTTRYYWTYEEFDDIWIPKTFTYINVSKGKSGLWRNSIRRIEFVENVVNEPLAEDEFFFAKIGLRPADRIYDGRTHIEYTFGQQGATEADMPPRLIESIVGKPMPEFGDIEIGFSPAQAQDRRILVCLWDMNQRPSRHCIRELAKRAEELKGKGVTIVAVQASKVDKSELDAWIKKYQVLFPVGMVQGDEEETRLNWGVKSLPWLILTDRRHIVRAEGFALGELDEKLVIDSEK
jgi:hypothetical protein